MTDGHIHWKGYPFETLLTHEGLSRLDADFLSTLKDTDQLLHDQLIAYRQGEQLPPKEHSILLIALAPILEAFLADFFDIEEAVGKLQIETLSHDPVFLFKTFFVLRQAKRALKQVDSFPEFKILDQWVDEQISKNALDNADRELAVGHLAKRFLEDPKLAQSEIDQLTAWCVRAMTSSEGQAAVKGWVSFKLPQKLNYENLVNVSRDTEDPYERLEGQPEHHRPRDGFALTDERMGAREVLDEVHYCVYCHKNDGDFCSKGFPVKKNDESQGLKINPLSETLTGCPLEEKISEMHALKKEGYGIAALAVVMIDNPMCPATGHRICNDCMKACIYQKQDPVDIPQVETGILTDVLGLPWGVEIYDLLTRWNPLRQDQWIAKPYNGLKVLVMGMGPAGFTLAHHLLMEGFAVVGAEGLKIEPLPPKLLEQPIHSFDSIKESLDDRVMAGFGGVAEYGITVRWDKNFLKLIYISLMRRQRFQVFGSVRFGGTLTVDDVWTLGFDHLALAVGAGLPRELHIPNSLASGMRQANDFLMALQLTGAAKRSSLANLQVRLPAVVIGGGLTGIDTATEVQAYYIVQVEKISERYQTLVQHSSEKTIRETFDPLSLKILDEYCAHAKIVQEERETAAKENRPPDFNKLIRAWGGVTVVYRRSMQESPAYKRNHEEVENALNEGIYYAEGLNPHAVTLDKDNQVKALKCKVRVMDEEGNWHFSEETKTLPAKAIFVATGAKPNIAYEFEHRGTFKREGYEYQRHTLENGELKRVEAKSHVKMEGFGAFMSYERDHHRVSFLGDTHPVFHGSVVKAIASAKRIYPSIVKSLEVNRKAADKEEYQHFHNQMHAMFTAEAVSVQRLTPNAIELKVRAPMAARNFSPGQFYRVQNYERFAKTLGDTKLQTEALALLAIKDQEDPDCLIFVALEEGASSRVLATIEPGEPLSVMGPTGAKMPIPDTAGEVMIIGGPMAAMHLLSIAPTLKAAGHRIFYVATFYSPDDIFYRDQLEAAADSILWLTHSDPMTKAREGDFSATGDLVIALRDIFQRGASLENLQQVLVVGSAQLVRTIQTARGALLKEFFSDAVKFLASVHGPMQCMLKGVCAQCLQWQIDPKTGERTKAVYACSWQNQPMDIIDIGNIDERLGQNKMQETLTNLWLDYLFEVFG